MIFYCTEIKLYNFNGRLKKTYSFNALVHIAKFLLVGYFWQLFDILSVLDVYISILILTCQKLTLSFTLQIVIIGTHVYYLTSIGFFPCTSLVDSIGIWTTEPTPTCGKTAFCCCEMSKVLIFSTASG